VVKVRLHSAGAASRLAALLLAQILPVFSLVAPCHPGASPPSVQRRTFATDCSAGRSVPEFAPASGSTRRPKGAGFELAEPGERIYNRVLPEWRTVELGRNRLGQSTKKEMSNDG